MPQEAPHEAWQPASSVARLTLTIDELNEIYGADNAASGAGRNRSGSLPTVLELSPERIVVQIDVTPEGARKGGTVAGGTIFGFFDSAGYMLTLAQSPKGTNAFTTDASIKFLRPCPLGRCLIEGRPLKFGRRASVVHITVTSPTVPDGPVASGDITFAPIFPGA